MCIRDSLTSNCITSRAVRGDWYLKVGLALVLILINLVDPTRSSGTNYWSTSSGNVLLDLDRTPTKVVRIIVHDPAGVRAGQELPVVAPVSVDIVGRNVHVLGVVRPTSTNGVIGRSSASMG